MNWCGSGAAQPTPSRRCLETAVGPAGLCSVLFAHQTGLAAAAALIWNVNRLLQYHSRERARHASELRSLSCSQQHLGTIKPPSWPSLYPTHLHVLDATVTCARPMHQNVTIIFVVSSFIFSVLLLTADWSVVCEYFWDEDVWTASSCCDSTVDVVKEAWADVMYINTVISTLTRCNSYFPLRDSCSKYQWTWWQHPTLPWCRARGLWALSSQQEAPLPKQPIIVILCSSDCMRNEEELDWGFLWQHTVMASVWPQREDCYSKGGEGKGEVLLIDGRINICLSWEFRCKVIYADSL